MEEVSDFNLVEGKMDLIMSDIVLLSKKEKAPENYVAIEPPVSEGGRLSFTKRYLAYSRERPNPRWGRVVVTDIKVLSNNQSPVGYRTLHETLDDGSKSFGSRTVAIKLVPQEEAVEAVTDLIILTGSKKDQVPNGYKRLPEINGFSICFQLTKMNKAPQARAAAPVTNRPRSGASIGTDNTVLYERQVSKKARSAVDGLSFKVNENNNTDTTQFVLSDMNLLSLDDIESNFKFDWSLEEQAQS